MPMPASLSPGERAAGERRRQALPWVHPAGGSPEERPWHFWGCQGRVPPEPGSLWAPDSVADAWMSTRLAGRAEVRVPAWRGGLLSSVKASEESLVGRVLGDPVCCLEQRGRMCRWEENAERR